MTRTTHLSYIIFTLITAAYALVPPQMNKAGHVARNVERRQIPAAQRKMLLEAAAAGLKLVHADAGSARKRQAPNQLCVEDDLLIKYQNDPEATPLCSALIAEPPVTSTVMTYATTTTTAISSTTRFHSTTTSTTTTVVETETVGFAGAKVKRQDDATFSSVISACNCLSIPLATITTTATSYSTRVLRAIQYVDPTNTSVEIITATSTTTVTPGVSTISGPATITEAPNPCGSLAIPEYWTSATTMSDGSWVEWEGYSCSASTELAWSTAWSTVRSGSPVRSSYANSTATSFPTPGSSMSGIPEPSPFPSNMTSYPPASRTGSQSSPVASTPSSYAVSLDTTCTTDLPGSTSVLYANSTSSTFSISSSVAPRTGSASPSSSSSFKFPGYPYPSASSIPAVNSTSTSTFSISSTVAPRSGSQSPSTGSSTPVGPIMNSTSASSTKSVFTPPGYPPYSFPGITPRSSLTSSSYNPADTGSTLPRTPGTFTSSSSSSSAPYPFPSSNSSSIMPGTGTGAPSSSAMPSGSVPYPFPVSNSTSFPGTGTGVPSPGPSYPYPSGNATSVPGTGTGMTPTPTPSSSVPSTPAGTGSTAPRTGASLTRSTSSHLSFPGYPFPAPSSSAPFPTSSGNISSTPVSPVMSSSMSFNMTNSTSSSSMPTATISSSTAPRFPYNLTSSSVAPPYPFTSSNSTMPPGTATSSTPDSPIMTSSMSFNMTNSTSSPSVPTSTITSATEPRYPFNLTSSALSTPTAPPYSIPGNSSTSSMPGTGTAPATISSSAPPYPVSSNSTSIFPTATSTPFSISSSVAPRSGSQTRSSSSTSICAVCTPLPASTTTSTVTTSVISTITVTQTTCSNSLPAYGYGPWGAQTPAAVGPPLFTPPPAPFADVQAACAAPGSALLNGGFEQTDDGTPASTCAAAWHVAVVPLRANSSLSHITFADLSALSVEETSRLPDPRAGGARLGRVTSTGVDTALGIWQPVVLCTGARYSMQASLRQVSGVCAVEGYVGTTLVFAARGAGDGAWHAEGGTFVSGAEADDASVFVAVIVRCDGPAVFDLDDVALSWAI